MKNNAPFRLYSAFACTLGLLLGSACTAEQNTDSPFSAPAPKHSIDLRVKLDPPEFGYQISSEAHLVKAGSESYRCDVIRVEPKGDEKLVWIKGAESISAKYTHHMNVYLGAFSFADAYLGKGVGESLLGKPLGSYPCDELGDVMENGAFPIYPSQLTHQVAQLPEGVAVPVVVPLMMVMQHHYINTGDEDVYINATVNFERIKEEDVEHVATAMAGGDEGISIPPKSDLIYADTCTIDRPVTMAIVSSHSHERAICFTANQYDNETSSINETPFFVNPTWDAPPLLFYEPDTWTLEKGDGVHWACHYRNREDRTVVGGLSAEDEMCIFVGIGYPNRLTVEDVKQVAADPLSFDLEKLLDDAIVGCDPVTAESPFPVVNEPIDDMEICGGHDPITEAP